jgi:hypothetical protein
VDKIIEIFLEDKFKVGFGLLFTGPVDVKYFEKIEPGFFWSLTMITKF